MEPGIIFWRSSNGTDWTLVVGHGFGEAGITGTFWSNASVVFQGNLLIGTSGPFGGVLWQLQR